MGVVIECIRIIEDSDKRGSDKRGCTVHCLYMLFLRLIFCSKLPCPCILYRNYVQKLLHLCRCYCCHSYDMHRVGACYMHITCKQHALVDDVHMACTYHVM